MVKGTSKRVVVVKSLDPKLFEQAIFILKEDLSGGGDRGYDILMQAQKVADDYIKNYVSGKKHFLSRVPPAAFAGLGAMVTAAAWLITVIL